MVQDHLEYNICMCHCVCMCTHNNMVVYVSICVCIFCYSDGYNIYISRSRPSSEGDDSLNSSSGGGRRLSSKHLERKEKFHGPPPPPPPPPPTQERPSPSSVPSGTPIEPTHPSATMTLSSSSGTSGVAPGGEISGAGGGGGKGGRGGRKESGSSQQHEHKRRKEEESGGSMDARERSGSTASSNSSRKRKRDQVDDEAPAIEAKKFRTSEQHHLSSSIAKDSERSMRSSREGGGGGAVGGASGAGVGGVEGAEARSSSDRKRRHEASIKEGPPRKQHLRSRSPETPIGGVSSGSSASTSGTMATTGLGSSSTSRRHERHGSSGRTVTSPTSKKGEHHHRSSKGASSSSSSSKKTEAGGGSAMTAGQESNDENDSLAASSMTSLTAVASAGDAVTPAESVRKKLDWASVSSYTRKASTKLEKRPTTALERFTPGAVFAHIGVSPSLAGKEYFDAISSHVSRHLRKAYQQKTVGDQGGGSNVLPKSLLDSPFEGQQFASSCVSRIKDQLEWERMVVDNVGPCRRALTASADYTIRRKLKKSNQVSNWVIELVVFMAICASFVSLDQVSCGSMTL